MSILQKIFNKFKIQEVDLDLATSNLKTKKEISELFSFFDVKRITSDLFDPSHREKRQEVNVYSCIPEFEVKCTEEELKEVIQGMMINFFDMGFDTYEGVRNLKKDSQGKKLYEYSPCNSSNFELIPQFDELKINVRYKDIIVGELKGDSVKNLISVFDQVIFRSKGRLYLKGGKWKKYDYIEDKVIKGKDSYNLLFSKIEFYNKDEFNKVNKKFFTVEENSM